MKYLKKFEEQKPVLMYHDNGQKNVESYYSEDLDHMRHRENGPARQLWYDNGQKQSEEYYIHGSRHREDGPAVQGWYSNGEKLKEQYYLYNKNYTRENWIKKLKEINSPHYEEQLMKYQANQYNI